MLPRFALGIKINLYDIGNPEEYVFSSAIAIL
jgi:hypothetical protein